MNVSEWTRDGHRITYRVTLRQPSNPLGKAWANVGLELQCPGLPACKARMVEDTGKDLGCNLQEWFSNLDSQEFLEEGARLEEGADFELPVEIEWAFEGWDDEATPLWRPV